LLDAAADLVGAHSGLAGQGYRPNDSPFVAQVRRFVAGWMEWS
jgi:hypothetical protein